MRFEVHRQNSANLKLFLDWWGFKCLFNQVSEDWDEIVVLPEGDDRQDLLSAIKSELESSQHIPYHLSLVPNYTGKPVKGDKAEFTGEIIQINEFQNVSGRFRLILFSDTENEDNWVWKCYGDKGVEIGQTYKVTGRVVCKLVGFGGQDIMLFNYARLKGVENEIPSY